VRVVEVVGVVVGVEVGVVVGVVVGVEVEVEVEVVVVVVVVVEGASSFAPQLATNNPKITIKKAIKISRRYLLA